MPVCTSLPLSRLIENCVTEARRRGIQPHKVAAYVRRRLAGGICIVRMRSDGSPGCSIPCTLCAKELVKYDLKVCCRLASGEVFYGRLTDPDAPSAKVTGGQRNWLTWWACCQTTTGGEPQQERQRPRGRKGGGGNHSHHHHHHGGSGGGNKQTPPPPDSPDR